MRPVLVISLTLLKEINISKTDSLLSKYTNKVSSITEIIDIINKFNHDNKVVAFLNVKEDMDLNLLEDEIRLALNKNHEELELYLYSDDNFEDLKLSFEETLSDRKISICDNVDHEKKIEHLKKIEGFDVFSDCQLGEMVKYVCIRTYDENEFLFKTGEKNNSLFFIVDGAVDIIKYSERGYEIIIGKIENHEVIGETTLVTENYNVNAKITKKSTVAIIKKDDMQELFSNDVDFETKILKLFIDKLHKKLGNLNNLHSSLAEDIDK